MKKKSLTIPEIALIGGTRVALGVGIGMPMAGKLNDDRRRGTGMGAACGRGLNHNSAGDEYLC